MRHEAQKGQEGKTSESLESRPGQDLNLLGLRRQSLPRQERFPAARFDRGARIDTCMSRSLTNQRSRPRQVTALRLLRLPTPGFPSMNDNLSPQGPNILDRGNVSWDVGV